MKELLCLVLALAMALTLLAGCSNNSSSTPADSTPAAAGNTPVADGYAVQDGPEGIGLVRHGTYSKKSPYNTGTPEGVDECVSWGDYFYMEALTRYTKDWKLYW